MFSRMELLATTEAIAERFNASPVAVGNGFSPNGEVSGFVHALHPVVVRNGREICDFYRWGLVPPDWRKKPKDIWDHTISAKLEYLNRRYAWQKITQNRCLVPATAYFEYHWNDPKGASKTKYRITNVANGLFALAGLYSVWCCDDGTVLKTFAVCTTRANGIMEVVHNKDAAKDYHRMPVMLNSTDEQDWLDTSIPCMDFAYPNYKPGLIATPVTDNREMQGKLLF